MRHPYYIHSYSWPCAQSCKQIGVDGSAICVCHVEFLETHSEHKLCSFVLFSLESQAVWLHSWHLHIPGLDVCNHKHCKFTTSYAIIIRSYISILRHAYSQGCHNIVRTSSSYNNKSKRLKDVSLFTITSITWFTSTVISMTLFNTQYQADIRRFLIHTTSWYRMKISAEITLYHC